MCIRFERGFCSLPFPTNFHHTKAVNVINHFTSFFESYTYRHTVEYKYMRILQSFTRTNTKCTCYKDSARCVPISHAEFNWQVTLTTSFLWEDKKCFRLFLTISVPLISSFSIDFFVMIFLLKLWYLFAAICYCQTISFSVMSLCQNNFCYQCCQIYSILVSLRVK